MIRGRYIKAVWCDNATVENSDLSYTDTVASGGTLVLPDIPNVDSDGATVNTPAQVPFVCTPCVNDVPQVWADMFEGRVLFDGGTFEDKTNLVTEFTDNFDLYNDAIGAITPSGYKAGTLYGFKPFDGSIDLSWTRATDATRFNESGLIETVSSNVPRIDYKNGEAVILVEPQRTNLTTYSEDFSNLSWVKVRASVNTSLSTDPMGAADSYKLVADTSLNTHFIYANTSVTGSETLSVFAKRDGYDFLCLTNSGFGTYSAWFDLDNGITGTNVGFDDVSIEDFGNGWYRCSATINIAPTTLFDFVIAVANADNVFSFTGDNVKGILIYGAQLEEGTEATTYIPTSGTAVTRNADVATNTPPVGTTKITEYFEGGSTNEITTIPATYTMSEGRLTKVIFE